MHTDIRRWLKLLETATPTWAYHGTLMQNIPDIAREGLRSNFRPKWSWDDSNKRRFHLLYFSLEGPGGWGKHKDYHASADELAELRFPLSALKRIRWQEDEEREERDEYYAVSRHVFAIPPAQIEIEYHNAWLPLLTFYPKHFYE